MMLQLGPLQFEARRFPYERLQRGASWRWPVQERFRGGVARQFTGAGDQSVSLSGALYPSEHGTGQLATLRAVADRGEPVMLVTGTGEVLGRWCIERVDETGQLHWADGEPRRVEFTVALVPYGEDLIP